jgi:uncharacterized membrane protein
MTFLIFGAFVVFFIFGAFVAGAFVAGAFVVDSLFACINNWGDKRLKYEKNDNSPKDVKCLYNSSKI